MTAQVSGQASGLSLRNYLVVLSVIWGVSLITALVTPASWDVAWRLEIAQRILDKAVLYRDIIELNPPLWFWSAVPSAFVSQVTTIAPYAVMAVAVHLVAILGLYLLDRCVQPFMSPTQRMWLVTGTLIALLLIPTNDIGQREPPIFLAALLWAGLAVARAQKVSTPIWLVIGISAFAAYGFALKHYYLIIPIGIELWLAVKLRRDWRPIRPETAILALLGVAYGGIVLVFAPNFLPEIVPLVQLSYEDIRSINVADPLLHPLSMVFQSLLMIVPAYLLRDIIKARPFAQVCFLTVLLHVAVVFIQGKGFSNHFLAAKGMTFVLWAYACGVASQEGGKFAWLPRGVLGTLLIVWIALPIMAHIRFSQQVVGPATKPANTIEAVVTTVEAEPMSSRIFVVSTHAGLAFYLQWREQRQHFSRYYALWMMPGLLTSQRNPVRRDAATAQLDLVRQNTIADIQCAAPHTIIADTTTHGRAETSGLVAYDLKPMTVLVTDTAFNAWLQSNYNQAPETLGMTVWRAKLALGPSPTNCPTKP